MPILTAEIFADCVNERLGVALKAALLAYDATAEVGEITEAGGSVKFPKFKRVAVGVNPTKGVALSPASVDMNDCSAPVSQVASAVRVYDIEEAQIKGSTIENMANQTADAIAKKLDSDLIKSAISDAIHTSPCAEATALTIDELDTALANFGDDQENFAGILIHSKLLKSFRSMPEFTSVNNTYTSSGNGVISNGLVGYLYGNIPVVLSDNQTFDNTKNECITVILKQNALAYVLQEIPKIEEERNALLLANDIVASTLYATKLVDTSGCVVIRKTVA